MKTLSRRVALVVVLAAVALVAQDGWVTYSSQKYGFSMLVPQGTKMVDREFGRGWAGAYGSHEGVEFVGIAKMGRESEEDIIKFGVEYTGIDEKHWSVVDQGHGYKTYMAEDGDKAILAAVGVGSKASFLLFLKTTESDMHKNKAAYEKWYEGVRIN